MVLFIILTFLVSILTLTLILIKYARWNYGVLEKTGIPVIKPTLSNGSVPDLHRKVQTEEDIRRFQEFGSIWGLYEGRTPIIHVCDPDLIREIFVKDVEYFYDRRVGHFGDQRIDEILDYLPGEKWKKMRKLQTVLFSSGKIRQYSIQLKDAAEDFVNYLMGKCDENGRVKLDTRNAMDIVSLDGIARASFGIKLENVEDSNNLFFRGLKKLLGEGLEYDWLYSLSMTFPILHTLAPSFHIEKVLFDTFREIVTKRKEQRVSQSASNTSNNNPLQEKLVKPSSTNCNDLADLLVDCFDNLESNEFKRLGISETTILAQALNVTALDMISATLTMICYYLASNSSTQNKLHSELDEVIEDRFGGRIDHETIQCLPYLSACLNETLRLAPPLIRPERVCTKDWVSSDGSLKIKKDTVVMVPLWAAHRNPKYFSKPDAFIPERFLADSPQYEAGSWHPYAYTPFGVGLRNCIGMRLAIETLKLNVATIFQKFRVDLRPDTKLEFKNGMLFLLQFKPLHLDFIRRSKDMKELETTRTL